MEIYHEKNLLIPCCSIFLLALLAPEKTASQNSDWTFFRGSNLNGISETADIPLQ